MHISVKWKKKGVRKGKWKSGKRMLVLHQTVRHLIINEKLWFDSCQTAHVRVSMGFRCLVKDTSTCTLQGLGIEPLTPGFEDNCSPHWTRAAGSVRYMNTVKQWTQSSQLRQNKGNGNDVVDSFTLSAVDLWRYVLWGLWVIQGFWEVIKQLRGQPAALANRIAMVLGDYEYFSMKQKQITVSSSTRGN